MFTVVPYQQYGGHYTVLIQTTGFPVNYANIALPHQRGEQHHVGWRANHSYLYANSGQHIFWCASDANARRPVHHFDGTAPFGLTIYGGAPYDAYSYPAGLIFDAQQDPE
jgi:hypothetical protein